VENIFNFSNSYQKLGDDFFDKTTPKVVKNPQLLVKNTELLKKLNLEKITGDDLTSYLSGNKLSQNAISCVYAGHQFGHFNPQLGDGRAALLGEINTQNQTLDIQLKGCGRTKYSRSGDGLLALGPAIREYLVSEAMFYLGVKTTRCLSLVLTSDEVLREKPLRAAVLTRVLESNVRIGTFEYFTARGEIENVKKLADYTIKRNYPQVENSKNKYLDFFKAVAKNQAKLVAKFMGFGFIHGVLNTDNMAISGEVIDYGPCGFMDEFSSNKVFSSIDAKGRYAYKNQANIVAWNLSSLGYCLSSLIDDSKVEIEKVLNDFAEEFENNYNQIMACKLGFNFNAGDEVLIDELLKLLQKYQIDWTVFFRDLSMDIYPKHQDFKNWISGWQARRDENYQDLMIKNNPVFIPRNHQIEDIIQRAYTGDFEKFFEFNEVLKSPFMGSEIANKYSIPPKHDEIVEQTFCGT
jgi:uncharacterized protein YdiU (UPF0061 family)